MKLTRYTSILTAAMLLAGTAQTLPVTAVTAAAPASAALTAEAEPAAETTAVPADITTEAAAAETTSEAADSTTAQTTAFAEEITTVTTVSTEPVPAADGSIGENITWQLDTAGHLVIRGTGAMAEDGGNPFGSNAGKIKDAVIENADPEDPITTLKPSLFSGCRNLASVTLPDTIKTIGSSAFRGCSALTEITLPEHLTEIGSAAFRESGLIKAVLPGCALGYEAFYHCASMKELSIAEGTTIVPGECFRYCTSLESVWLPDSVKEIRQGDYESQGAFADCPQLKTVSIGTDIERIDACAFRTTGTGLEVTFRDGVTAIPASSFDGREELAAVILPDTLQKIGTFAFSNCTNLTGTVFPASLNEIGEQTFRHTALTEAVLPGCTLGNAAFYSCEKLAKVVINEGTEIIPSECFRYCPSLESVLLPDSVREIQRGGYDAMGCFADCPQLKTVSIGKGIESIDRLAFRTTGTGLEVTFRDGVTAIPASSFDGREELSSVILPDTLESVGALAFRNCVNLTGTVFPASLKEIGNQAFCNTALTEAVLPGCTLGINAFDGCKGLKKVVINEGTEIIPSECFRFCTSLESVWLPDSVKEIRQGEYESMGCFADCPQLKTVSIGTGIESINPFAFRTTGTGLEVTFRDGVTAIPASSFDGREELSSVILPDTLESVGAFAFRDCVNLTGTVFPASLKEIGNHAFRNTGLTEAVLPGCTLGINAFYNCKKLEKVVINEGTEIIPSECFRFCPSLESVWLPDSVKEIRQGEYESMGCFADCPQLKTVSIGKGIESINSYAFRTTGTGLEVTFRDGVTAIPASSFDGRGEVSSVILPDTLESVGALAFRDCVNLTGTVFPASMKEIGNQAFRNTGLTEAVLPGCTLGINAFYGCKKLEKVVINEGTEIIPSECFRYCTSLRSVWLPDSVREIQRGEYDSYGAFADCPKMEDVSIGKGIEKIDTLAFRTESKELDVTFRDGAVKIPDGAFRNRGELVRLVVPESAKALGEKAITNCRNLRVIVFQSPGCTIPDSADAIPESADIYGYRDSTAEAYAEKYGRTFIPLRENDPSVPFACDLNADGKTDTADAELLFRVVTEGLLTEGELDYPALYTADLDCSGTLTIKDVSLLLLGIAETAPEA